MRAKLLTAVATTLLAAHAGVAQAAPLDELPPCSTDYLSNFSPEIVSPKRVTPGTTAEFVVNPAGFVAPTAYATLDGASWRMYEGIPIGPVDFRLGFPTRETASGTLTLTLRWRGDDAEGLGGCLAEKSATAIYADPSKRLVPLSMGTSYSGGVATASLTADIGEAKCDTFADTPLTFTVRSRGRSKRLGFDNQCVFNRRETKLRDHWYLRSDGSALELLAYNAGPRRQTFRLTVRRGAATKSWTRVLHRRRQPKRTYYEGSDEFFNYCVKQHPDRIRQRDGVKYCTRPGTAKMSWTGGQ